jgi:tetratricopeptide (TPR) repeat protein
MTEEALLIGMLLAQAAKASPAKVAAPAPKPSSVAPRPALPFAEVARRAREARDKDQLDEAIRWYREGVRQRPGWDEGLWYLATLLYDKDRFGEARDAFRSFLILKPQTGPAWALRGMCEFKLKDYPGALRSLEKGTDLGYGTNTAVQRAAWFHLSMLLVRGGHFELAVRPLTWLARSEPESERLIEVAGLMLLRMPKLPGDIAPESRELVMLAGRAAYSHLARDGEHAGERFRELIQRFPNAPNVHYAHGIFLASSDSDAAVAEFRKELEIQPQSVFARLDLAFELIRRGDFREAVEPSEEAVKLAPGLFAAHNALGRALAESGDLTRGIPELELAAKLAPESPEMHFALARAYAKAGRKEDAARARATFAELDRKRRERKEGPLVEMKSGGPG